jgi:hypothetical protein
LIGVQRGDDRPLVMVGDETVERVGDDASFTAILPTY